MFLPPARALRFDLNATSTVLLSGAAIITGWSITNGNASTVSECDIYDDVNDQNDGIAAITLLGNESVRDLWAPSGIEVRKGIFVIASTGAVYGTIYAIPGEVVDAFMLTQGYQPLWRGGE